ncbi:hypothetical protein L6452_26834 [Arctium lappa]|uniref:Uncharacterized protein n=1 Tax=Arctium lappa TaxID=4217 RepID=A0ACB8ZWC5_ARCLA|nr:hypothetical protein L6452_26834 [Arctium lappa]
MLVRSSLPSSFDAGLSSVPDNGKQEISCVWIPGEGSWQEPTVYDEHPQQGQQNAAPVTQHKNKDDSLCSQNFLSSSQLSTEVNMSETSRPNFVYKRKLIRRNAAAVLPLSQSSTPTLVYKRRKVQTVFLAQVSTNTRESDNGFSTNSSAAISIGGKEQMVSVLIDNGIVIPSAPLPVESNRPGIDSKSGSVDGTSLGDELVIEEPKSKMQKCSDLRAVNDSCSSSKLNLDLGSASLKHQVDDVGECSSSGVLVVEGLGKDISGTNSCISFLQRHGVLQGLLSTKTSRSTKPVGANKSICCLRLCKVCGRSTTTLEMLICDMCEESFHVSCCNPPIKKVPVGDWFCHSCLRKKLKKMKETSSSKSPKDYSGPIASILRDAGPYTTNVRIGRDFQAEIPDWSGPLTRDLNVYSEPVELSPLDCASYQDLGSSKLSRLSSIGNWLQCREVVDGVDGTICGKWRRAPLFEVQTDDWECFCSVLWDPTHADCAVPQELDTDQVLKQLKYIEMLRPRLSVKRWKLGVNKGIDRQEHTRNTPKL